MFFTVRGIIEFDCYSIKGVNIPLITNNYKDLGLFLCSLNSSNVVIPVILNTPKNTLFFPILKSCINQKKLFFI